MAPKRGFKAATTAGTRLKRGRAGVGEAPADTADKTPNRELSELDDASDTADKNTGDELALVECKEEDTENEPISGARRAAKGEGMNPLEVSRMLTMLKKRRKKDCVCMRMCSTHLGIYINIDTHIYVHMCITIWRSPRKETRPLLEETTRHATHAYCVTTQGRLV
jgi:hypothetical protein